MTTIEVSKLLGISISLVKSLRRNKAFIRGVHFELEAELNFWKQHRTIWLPRGIELLKRFTSKSFTPVGVYREQAVSLYRFVKAWANKNGLEYSYSLSYSVGNRMSTIARQKNVPIVKETRFVRPRGQTRKIQVFTNKYPRDFVLAHLDEVFDAVLLIRTGS